VKDRNDRRGFPDEDVLPRSGGRTLDKDGVDDEGYLDKKGAPAGQKVTREGIQGQILNHLPPGMNIDEQHLADINPIPFKSWEGGGSYPGDGGFPREERTTKRRRGRDEV
jgi:hypothetical protein